MANGQTDVGRSTRRVVGAILLILLLGWLLGWFSSNEEGLAHMDNEATVDEAAAIDEVRD